MLTRWRSLLPPTPLVRADVYLILLPHQVLFKWSVMSQASGSLTQHQGTIGTSVLASDNIVAGDTGRIPLKIRLEDSCDMLRGGMSNLSAGKECG